MQLQPNLCVSSSALLFNATRALMHLCAPFMDPADPKTVRIDLRFMSNTCLNGRGGGRFLATEDAQLAPAAIGGDEADDDSARTQSWVDARNLARSQQFRDRQAALLRAAGASAPAAPPSKAKNWSEFHPITEMYFLTLRAAHLGLQAALHRQKNIARQINHLKKERTRIISTLRNTGFDGGVYPPHIQSTYAQLIQVTSLLRGYLLLLAVTRVFVDDEENRRDTLQFYRLHAVLMTRAVDPRE